MNDRSDGSDTRVSTMRGHGAEFQDFMAKRGFDVIYMDSAKFAEFMKTDDQDNGKTLKTLGLAK